MHSGDKNGTSCSTEEITWSRIGEQIVFTKDSMIFLIRVQNSLFTHIFCWAWLEIASFQKGQIWLKVKAFPSYRYLSKGFALNFLDGSTVVFYCASAWTGNVENKNTNHVLDCFMLQPLELLDLCLQFMEEMLQYDSLTITVTIILPKYRFNLFLKLRVLNLHSKGRAYLPVVFSCF